VPGIKTHSEKDVLRNSEAKSVVFSVIGLHVIQREIDKKYYRNKFTCI
jgi:hypothetical protein